MSSLQYVLYTHFRRLSQETGKGSKHRFWGKSIYPTDHSRGSEEINVAEKASEKRLFNYECTIEIQ